MDLELGSLLPSALLLFLLIFIRGKQVSSTPCEAGQVYCQDAPSGCCESPGSPESPGRGHGGVPGGGHGPPGVHGAPREPWLKDSPPMGGRSSVPPNLPLPHPQPFPPPTKTSNTLYAHALPLWTNWYFWVVVALLVLSSLFGCGYWRRRKIYESSASQTLAHGHSYHAPTPSDDTPMYGPPLPFLPPVPYPAPPPYCEAARSSFDPMEQHIYDAMLQGRSVYDFYDRRHPNAYYDRYFLPDDTSSSETTSLLSYRLQRSCSAHLHRHHSLRKQDMLAPPPYYEVAAKPELYPVVMVSGGRGSTNGRSHGRCNSGGGIPEVKSAKCMSEHGYGTANCSGCSSGHTHTRNCSSPWPPGVCHNYFYRSGSVSTPEGSQTSSYTGCPAMHSEYGRSRMTSPGCILAMASPVSSVGPHNTSDVSSLPPTSPPSPPAPTSPTLPTSPATRELRDVLQKISQLPGSGTPTLTPGHSPLSPMTPGCSHSSYSSPRESPASHEEPLMHPGPQRGRRRRPLGASHSLESSAPTRPRSLPLCAVLPSSPHSHTRFLDPPSPLPASSSTPNLAQGAEWPPSPPHMGRTMLMASLVDGTRVVQHPIRDDRHCTAERDRSSGRDRNRDIIRERDRGSRSDLRREFERRDRSRILERSLTCDDHVIVRRDECHYLWRGQQRSAERV